MGVGVVQGTLPEYTDLKFITSVSFNAAASVSVDGCFGPLYQHYVVTRNLLASAGASTEIYVRLRASGSTTSAANYREQYVYADTTNVVGGRTTGNTYWGNALGRAEATTFGLSQLRISNPYEVVRTTAWADYGQAQTGTIIIVRRVFAHDLAASYDGFTATPASGTITGSISVWGVTA